jgi:hypothetical protein
MTKFLTTSGVSYHLENLIKNANEKLILISPYLKVSDKLKQLLEDKDRLKIDIRLIYKKNELQTSENNWLKSLHCIRSSFCENLHAKCYLNENEAIITSMNLHEYSQVNNNEMGIYINRNNDPDLYNEILIESMRLVRISDEKKIAIAIVLKNTGKTKKQPTISSGYCIRCKTEIKINPMYPYCLNCYNSWKDYENPDYEEKYCHICGKNNKSTLTKPTCYSCFKKNKGKLEFRLVNSTISI